METQNHALVAEKIKMSMKGRPILSGIDLSLPCNKVTAIMGPSGCGKSTLLLCLAGMQNFIPQAQFSGRVRKQNPHDFIGIVFQRPTPFRLSIYENVAIALRERKLTKQQISSSVQRAMTAAGIWDELKDRLNEPAHDLSGGQLQRLCLARVLALDPAVLLLDEPCSSLDPLASQAIEQTIREIAETKTLLLVTHNLAQAKRLSVRLIVLWDKGSGAEIIEQADTDDLFRNPQNDLVKNYLSGAIG